MADHFQVPTDLKSVSSENPEKKELAVEGFGERVVVSTPHGDVTVNVQRATEESFCDIITYHEVGLNGVACFEGFVNHPDAEPFRRKTTFYHITAPGQAPGEKNLTGFYPNMDQLAEQVGNVIKHFNIKKFIGLGAGAGANVLLRYVADNQLACLGLCMMSPLLGVSSWSEWGFKKVITDVQTTFSDHLTGYIMDQFIGTYFSPKTVSSNVDLVKVMKDHMHNDINGHNFGSLFDAYVNRSDLNTVITPEKFRVPVLICYGGQSIHNEAVVDTLRNYQPDKMSHLEIYDTGDLVHLERPDEVLRAFKLLLAGLSMII